VTEFPSEGELLVKKDEKTPTTFEFDKVFTPQSTQVKTLFQIQIAIFAPLLVVLSTWHT
jgi:hypothetical protein